MRAKFNWGSAGFYRYGLNFVSSPILVASPCPGYTMVLVGSVSNRVCMEWINCA